MPPPVTRTQIIREPGLIQYNGATFYSQEAITVTQKDELSDVNSVNFGKLEDRPSDRSFEIALRPVGAWENLATLFPYFAFLMGQEIFGSSDVPLVVWTQSGRKYTFKNVAITTPPDISPKVGDTLLQDMTFTGLLSQGAYPGDANAYYTLATGQTYPGDSAFNRANILTRAPWITWNNSINPDSPTVWDSFGTVDGVQIKHDLSLEAVKVNGLGTVGMRIKDYQISAQFQPVGAFEMSDILNATGGNLALGSSPTINDLNIAFSGFYVRLYNAALRQSSFKMGTAEGDNLVQGLEARATRSFSAGAPVPLAFVGTTSPS